MHGDKSASQKTVRDKRNEKASVDMEPLLPTTKDSPTKKKNIGDVPMGNTVPHSISLGVQTQDLTELCYGRKKLDEFYP